MKTLLASMLVAFSFSAMAACNPEAQFIGEVTKLKVYESHFTFQVRVTRHFSPSIVCPMYGEDVESAVLAYPGKPSIKNGDEISGVMVYDVATDSYKID
ncbi:hypothetical protein ACJVC5_03815 [Peredibacter sp. HCB2-198]|uniref:hypothetical protein n=1 Tax=Peredibacter sp. HCB2-198 TaxID=3383025 RepID=UPI0038B48350